MTTDTATVPRSRRVYRRCRNPQCQARLKTRQHVLCASCRLAGGYGALVAGVVGAALKVLGVI